MNTQKSIALIFCTWFVCLTARGDGNVSVVNPTSRPVPVSIQSGSVTVTGAGDATAANQTAVQATAGNNASKANGVQGITNGIAVTVIQSSATTVVSTAKEASHVLKGSAGSLISVAGASDTDQWILIMNSTTVPANGAVTLLYPPIHVAAGGNFHLNFTTPLVASTGIAICNSTANSFTKTIGAADCVFSAQVQ